MTRIILCLTLLASMGCGPELIGDDDTFIDSTDDDDGDPCDEEVTPPDLAFTGPGRVVINEFAWWDGSSQDWIELFNVGGETVDLDGWYLTDEIASHDIRFHEGTTLAPGEFLVLKQVGTDVDADLIYGFGLHSSDSIQLYDTEGRVDCIDWDDDLPKSQIAGRYPDGDGEFLWLSCRSPGGYNYEPDGDETDDGLFSCGD